MLDFRTNILQLINIYGYILLIYVILSWVPGARNSKFGEIITKLCEPYLNVFKRMLPFSNYGGIDLTPLIGFFALRILYTLFVMILY